MSSANRLSDVRHKGKVLWFSASLGYGFIKPESKDVNEGKDLFVHYHSIVQAGFKIFEMNDIVEFSLGENQRGMCAMDVKLLKRMERTP